MFKPSSLVFLLLLLILIQVSQGIRLEKGFMQVMDHNGGLGEVIECKEGHCKGMDRKPQTLTTSTTVGTTSKENKSQSVSRRLLNDGKTSGEQENFRVNTSSSQTNYEYDHHQAVTGHDNSVDIMDYSQARRKTPIHN